MSRIRNTKLKSITFRPLRPSLHLFHSKCLSRLLNKLLPSRALEDFKCKARQKVQGWSVVNLFEILNSLKQRSNWEMFNCLLGFNSPSIFINTEALVQALFSTTVQLLWKATTSFCRSFRAVHT